MTQNVKTSTFTLLPSACTVVVLMASGTLSAASGLKLEFHMVLTVHYAGECLGEARNPGPATHKKDRPAADQRNTSLRRPTKRGIRCQVVKTQS